MIQGSYSSNRYHTVRLYLDTFTQHIWGYKFKTAGTGKTTVKSLEDIYGGFTPAEVFMSTEGNISTITKFNSVVRSGVDDTT